ncbi:MAG TPA: FAD-binding oxidoreductase, partial [Gemmatimonadaceae bacterium]|nr:FAD-binding oxidoreductase [Gemmatimonadaceae bacterium]
MGAVNLAERLHWGSVAPSADTYAKEAEGLADELTRRIQGEVRFSDGDRALYAADLSMFRQVPVGVVVPRTVDDVVETVAACRSRGIPILGRGCGTSLAGQCCNVAVVIDFSKYLNRILEIDPEHRTAWVEPGVICDQLRGEAEKHGLTWAPDPATHEYCTFGGMIGNDSCGVHSVMGGKTVDNIEELEILTYEGHRFHVGPADDAEIERIIREGGPRGKVYNELRDLRDRYADEIRQRFPDIPRRVSGYNLVSLLPEYGFHVARALVGSEGTCVLVLRAKLRLIPSPPKRALVVIGYEHVGVAADQVPAIMDIKPIALEAVHRHVPENMARKGDPLAGAQLLPQGNAWLLVEFGGDTQDEATGRARDAMRRVDASGAHHEGMKLIDDPGEQDAVWKVREAGVGASRVPGVEDAWPSWEDSAVSPEKLGAYLRDLIALIQRYDYAFTLFGHFGQGCIHSRIAFNTRTPEGVA